MLFSMIDVFTQISIKIWQVTKRKRVTGVKTNAFFGKILP